MAIATDFDLEDYIPDGKLRRGTYSLEIQRAEDNTERGYLAVFGTWLDGPPDVNDKQVEGREAAIFLTTRMDKIASYPNLVRQAKNVLKKFTDAVGDEPDEMPGRIVKLAIKVRDSDSGQNIDIVDVLPMT